MKAHNLVLTATCLLALGCSGQSTSDGSVQVVAPVVSALKSNVLYLGFDNPLDIGVAEVPCSSLKVLSDNGAVVGDSCQYSIRPERVGMATITISGTTTAGKPFQGQTYFRVREVPAPIPVVGGRSLKDGSVDREALSQARGVLLKLEDFLFDVVIRIERFELTVVSQEQPARHYASTSAEFTEEMKAVLLTLKTGEAILIHGIRANGPSGEIPVADLYLAVL
ncbi:MAG: GldM family protein [Flavobacteriales bacterium]